MCVIIVVKDKFPTLDFLKLCEEKNREGGGIAWTDGKKVVWKKGISAKEIYKMKGQVTYPFVIHFRSSALLKTKEFCHPFPVSPDVSTDLEGEANKVLMHNGSWTGFREAVAKIASNTAILYKGEATDTRGIAWLYYHLGDQFLAFLNHKIAVMEPRKVKTFGKGWRSKDSIIVSSDPTTSYSKPKSEDAWTE